MGTIDKSTHTFVCPKCNANETATVFEKGSTWGSSWQSPPITQKFKINWTMNRFGEPLPIAVVCKTCGSTNISVISK